MRKSRKNVIIDSLISEHIISSGKLSNDSYASEQGKPLSISINTGGGIRSWFYDSSPIKNWFDRYSDSVYSIEKSGDKAHLQAGILTSRSPKDIRQELLGIFGNSFNEKQKRHAIEVRIHPDWIILQGYCLKDYYRHPPYFKFGSCYNVDYLRLVYMWCAKYKTYDYSIPTNEFNPDYGDNLYLLIECVTPLPITVSTGAPEGAVV